VATLIDKNFIIKRIMQNSGIAMHSPVPPGNVRYYKPDVPLYGHGESTQTRIRMAYEILQKAGYTWDIPPVDASGKLQEAEGIKNPKGEYIKTFTILTPPADYDPHRAMSGMMAQGWLRTVGLPAVSRPMAFGALIQKIKDQRDFDCFVLGYGRLSLDCGYMRIFFHSSMDRRRGWNMSGYCNPEYDRIGDASDNEMDSEKRRQLILTMQKMIVEDVPYIPLYNPLVVEGVRTERFYGWVSMLGGIGNIWSFCQLKDRR
jgi:ABC-type transport system substrate-binding protein